MTDKTIMNTRKVGGDYFKLIYLRSSTKYLSDHLTFDFEDYWCYKTTDKQRLVTYEEFLEFKYSSYTFFKKDLYNTEHIDLWIREYGFINPGNGIKFLDKPLPPFTPDKIKIMK